MAGVMYWGGGLASPNFVLGLGVNLITIVERGCTTGAPTSPLGSICARCSGCGVTGEKMRGTLATRRSDSADGGGAGCCACSRWPKYAFVDVSMLCDHSTACDTGGVLRWCSLRDL